MTPRGQTTLRFPVLQTKGLGPMETADSPKVVKSVFTACCSHDCRRHVLSIPSANYYVTGINGCPLESDNLFEALVKDLLSPNK